MFHRLVRLVTLVSALSTVACLPARSPFDPEAPLDLQAKAGLSGVVRANVSVGEDDQRPAVEGARVRLVLVDGTSIDTNTDEDGAFSLTEFYPGKTVVEVDHPAYQLFTETIEFAPGERRNDLTVYLAPFTDRDPDLIVVDGSVLRDAKENHAGIEVRSALDPGRVLATTQSDGRVEVRLPKGTHTLLVDDYGYVPTEFEVVADDATGANNSFQPVTLAFVPGTVSGVVSVEDPAVAQAITLSLDKGGVDEITADGNGEYVVTPVPFGTYVLTAFADGHDAVQVAGVEVFPNEDTPMLPLYLPRSRGSIAGVARYAPGFDDDNTGITVAVAGTSASAVTDIDGNFIIDDVPTLAAGGHTLTVTAADFLTQTVPGVLVTKNTTTTLDTDIVLAKQVGDFDIVSTDPPPPGFPGGYTKTPDVVLRLSPIPAGATQLRVGESADLSALPYVDFPLDGGQIDPDVPYTLQGADGQIVVYVQFLLDDGSEAGPFSAAIVLDQAPPVVQAPTLGNGSGLTNQNNIIVSVAATDATSSPRVYEVSEDMTFTGLSPIVSEDYGVPSVLDFVDQVNDGPRTVYVRVTDSAGNVSDPVAGMIVRDTVAPVLNAFSLDCQGDIDAPVCRDTTVSLTIDSPDATRWYVSLLENPPATEDDWHTFAEPQFFAGLSQAPGVQTLYLYLRDGAGNVSASFSDSIEIDTQAPTGASVRIESGATYIGAGTTTVDLELFALGAADMRISTDPDTSDDPTVAYATSSTVTLPGGLSDGPFTVYVAFVDAAGNEITVNDSIIYDSTAPSPGATPVTIDQGAAFARALSVSVSFDVDDATEMQIATDGTPDNEQWVPYAGTTIVLLPAGDCTAAQGACKSVCARFRDEAGNVTASPVCDAIALDTTPPSVPVITATLPFTDQATFTLPLAGAPTDENAITYEILVQPANGAFTPIAPTVASPPTFSVPLATGAATTPAYLASQDNVIRLRAKDAAGNISPEASYTVVYDAVNPPAPVLTGDGTIINADTYSLLMAPTNQSPSDATFAYYEVGQGNNAGASAPAAWNATAQADGLLFSLTQGDDGACNAPCVNKLFVRAVDAAGNISPTSSVIIREDSTAPTKPSLTPKVARVPGRLAPMRLQSGSMDNGSPVVAYEIRGGTIDSYTSVPPSATDSVVFELIDNQVNELCIRGRDAAGNVGTEDCSDITQSTDLEVANAQELEFFDLEGSFFAYVDDRRDGYVYDLRTDSAIDGENGFFGFGVGDTPFITVSVEGDTAYFAVVVNGPGGWVSLYSQPANQPLSAPSCDIPNGTVSQPCETEWSTVAGYDVHGGTRVALGEGHIAAFIDNGGGGYLIEVSPYEDLGVLDSPGSATEVCQGTRPHIAGGMLVWCDDTGGGSGARAMRAPLSGSAQIIDNNIDLEVGDIFDSPEDYHEVVANDDAMFWVKGGVVYTLKHSASPGAQTALPLLTDRVQLLHAVDDDRLVYVGWEADSGPGLGNASVYIYDLANPTAEPTKVSDSFLTPFEAGVDGPRVVWADRSGLDATGYFRDLQETHWLNHGPMLTAFASTDGAYTTWIDTRSGVPEYYGFDHATNAEFALPITPSFTGIVEGSHKTAAGQRAFVREVGANYQMATIDLTTLTPVCTVSATATATVPIDAYALSNDGDSLAFAQGDRIYTVTRAGACWGTPVQRALATTSSNPDETNDITFAGNFVVWEQELVTNQNELWCHNLSNGNTLERIVPNVVWSEPDLEYVGGVPTLVANEFDGNGGAGDIFGLATCTLVCSGATFCQTGTTEVQKATWGGGRFSRPSLNADGMVMASEEGPGYPHPSHLFVWDLVTGKTRTTPPAAYDFQSATDVSVGDGRASYGSIGLGTVDIWTTTLMR